MIRLSQKGLEFIESRESYEPFPYDDGYGGITIGYGHLIKEGEHFTCLSREQALEILSKDVEIAEKVVERYISVPLTDNQYDALVSLTFNCGSGALKKSIVRGLINSNAPTDKIVKQWKRSFVTSAGRVSRGLIARRLDESEMYKEV